MYYNDIDELYESYISSPYKLGDVGEVLTSQALRNELGMKVLRHIYLPYRGRLTEIDIIALSSKGIFIIENKNYNATIYGCATRKYWKACYKYNSSYLYNPILQNRLHKDVFKSVFNTDLPIFSPVIFNDKANLNISGCDKSVFLLSKFVERYKNFNPDNEISSFDLNKLTTCIKSYSDASDEAMSLHLSMLGKDFSNENFTCG